MTDLPIKTKQPLTAEEEAKKKAKKAKKKKEKWLRNERTFIGFERTLLAWIRTSTSLLTFGFAIIKLLSDEARLPGHHPILNAISPKVIGYVMVLAGFIGLAMAVSTYTKYAREFGKTQRQTYTNQAMIVSYVILILSGLILSAPFIKLFLTP